MKKQTILSCALTAALFGSLVGATAIASNSQLPVTRAPTKATIGSLGAEQQTVKRFIVTYREGSREGRSTVVAERSFNTALSRSGMARAHSGRAVHMRKLAIGSDLFKVNGKGLDRVQAERLMQQIAADPNVVSVYPDDLDRPVRGLPAPTAFTPNDTLFNQYQWNFKAPNGAQTPSGNVNHGSINVQDAWDMADGNGVVIAVLDTGHTKHPDLDSSLGDAGYDFITDKYISGRDSDGRVAGGWDLGDWTNTAPWINDSNCVNLFSPPRESSWHGSHVASIAGAALTNNNQGLAGVAYNAKILPVRVLGHCGGYPSDISDAIIWAAGGDVPGVPKNQNPAHVINMSLGGSRACTADSPYAKAIKRANELGAVVVVAAGNSDSDAADFSPASCPGAITVASNGYTSRRAFYSNYGQTVEISAPGGGVYVDDGSGGNRANPDGFIWGAVNPGSNEPVPLEQIDPSDSYGNQAGTSQASPHVAGVVALMQGARLDAQMPLLTPNEVVKMLQRTATAFHIAPEISKPIGAGIVNAAAAVKAAVCTGDECGPQATPLPLGRRVTGLQGGELLFSVEAEAGKTLSLISAGGRGDVSMYVSFDIEPSETSAQFKSSRKGNNETVRVTAPKAGTYYVKLVGEPTPFNGVTLMAVQ